jgi:phospholipid/cholesterol/gamma-HCH transport system substrate-binding protein
MPDRSRQLTISKFKAGWIVSIALMIVFITIFFLGNITNLVVSQALLELKVRNVSGLRKGAPVWLLGVQIGSVKSIKLHPKGPVVFLSVDKNDLQFIHQDARAVIRTMGLLGEMYLEIEPGTVDAGPIHPGSVITGAAEIGFKQIMATSTQSIEEVHQFIQKLDELIGEIAGGKGALGELIKNPAVYQKVNQTLENLSSLLKELREERGTLQLMVKDPSLYNKMLSAAASVEKFGQKLDKSSGSLEKFIRDPSLYDRLNTSADRLAVILGKIDRGEGLAGKMVTNEELSNDLQEVLMSLKELIQDIKNNPHKYFTINLF